MSDGEPPGQEPYGLDPDRAIADRSGADARPTADRAGAGHSSDADGPASARPAPRRVEPVIDTRRYQRMIAGFGLLLVVIFSIVLYARHTGGGTPGIAAGRQLHRFVAPLATSDLDRAANTNPHCNPARPARQGLNVCGREPIVLAFFAVGRQPCIREVDTLQRVAPQFPGVTFAAVAVAAGRAQTAQLVRSHHWTIPVAFDVTGAVGELYGVVVCPIVELARAGGTVAERLIGESWERPSELAAAVRRMQAG